MSEEEKVEYLGPKTEEFYKRYEKVMKFLPAVERLSGVCVAKAEGSWLIDVDGNKYIDMSSQWATNNAGNCNPRILKAAIEALKQWGFLIGFLNDFPPQVELAEKLRKIMPPKLTRVTYEISGTEAAENAVQNAMKNKKRPLIISFTRQYSGMSIGAKNIGSLGAFLKSHLEAMHGGVVWAPYPISYRTPGGLTQEEYVDWVLHDYIEEEILKYIAAPDRIAGIYFEPMAAEGGHWIPPKNFIQGLRGLADKYDWLLVCDEVLVGLGRTGKWFGIEHYNTPVDVMSIGKALCGGTVPVAAILGSEEVLGRGEAAVTGGTFAGCPAGCAAGSEFIDIVEEEKLLPKVARNGEKAMKRMKEWVDEYEIVGDARGIGYLLAIEIVKDKKTEEADAETAGEIFHECVRNGMLPVWDPYVPLVRLLPCLTLEDELLDKALTILEDAVKKVLRSKS